MKKTFLLLFAGCFLFITAQTKASTVAAWEFNTTGTYAPNPAPFVGSGMATALGMDNTYGTPATTSTNASDITATSGSSNSSFPDAWRIRGGPTSGGNAANGWSTNAPIGTQGAQFSTSTVGFQNIELSFDVYITTTAEAKLAVEYTTNGSTWNLANNISYSGAFGTIQNNSTSANTVMGNFLQITTGDGNNYLDDVSVDLSGISSANNDLTFGVRLVNAATGADDTGANGGTYNNSSGNWRFDNVIISASPVPEPSTLFLSGLGIAAMFISSRQRKN